MTLAKQDWPPVFLEFIRYLRINSKEVPAIDSRGAPLNLWESQKIVLDTIVDGMEHGAHTFMFGKARQLGISTIFEALDIFWLATHPGMMGAYVIDKDKNLPAIRDKIKRYFASFPPGFFGTKFQIENDNKEFMLFSNGSRLDFLTAGVGKKQTHWGEGKGYALAHLTECSKYGSPESLASFRETLADTNPDRLFVYESTSNGMNHWREMWEEFGRDSFGKRRMFLGWWSKDLNRIPRDDPRYKMYGAADPDPAEIELIDTVERDYGYKVKREQLAWYRYKHSDLTTTSEDMRQNLPWTIEESFVASGHSFFNTAILQDELTRVSALPYQGYRYLIGTDFWTVKLEQIHDPNLQHEITLRVWEEPEEDATYAIGCDPAYGRDELKDKHSISVWRCFGDKLVQVAEYADNEDGTRQAAWVLCHLAGAYRNCLINVEAAPGPGGVIINELENLRERMRIDPKFDAAVERNDNWEDFLSNARWYIYKKPDHFSPGFVKCWESNWKTKPQMMEQLRDKYAQDMLLIRSTPLVEEMMAVIRTGDTIEAPKSANDDRVIALALANRAWMDSLMMPLLSQGETFEAYVRAQNGESVDKTSKFMNNIVATYFQGAEERAQMLQIPPEKQWLYDRGFL